MEKFPYKFLKKIFFYIIEKRGKMAENFWKLASLASEFHLLLTYSAFFTEILKLFSKSWVWPHFPQICLTVQLRNCETTPINFTRRSSDEPDSRAVSTWLDAVFTLLHSFTVFSSGIFELVCHVRPNRNCFSIGWKYLCVPSSHRFGIHAQLRQPKKSPFGIPLAANGSSSKPSHRPTNTKTSVVRQFLSPRGLRVWSPRYYGVGLVLKGSL